MVGRCVTINLLAPANIIATAIEPSTTSCTGSCTVDVTITWYNAGDLSGSFTPGMILDGGTPTGLSPESLGGGQAVSHTFTTPTLMAGSHSICASPDLGVTCQTITVAAVPSPEPPGAVVAAIAKVGGIVAVGLAAHDILVSLILSGV